MKQQSCRSDKHYSRLDNFDRITQYMKWKIQNVCSRSAHTMIYRAARAGHHHADTSWKHCSEQVKLYSSLCMPGSTTTTSTRHSRRQALQPWSGRSRRMRPAILLPERALQPRARRMHKNRPLRAPCSLFFSSPLRCTGLSWRTRVRMHDYTACMHFCLFECSIAGGDRSSLTAAEWGSVAFQPSVPGARWIVPLLNIF